MFCSVIRCISRIRYYIVICTCIVMDTGEPYTLAFDLGKTAGVILKKLDILDIFSVESVFPR